MIQFTPTNDNSLERDEFEKRVRHLMNWKRKYGLDVIVDAIIDDKSEVIQQMREEKTNCENKINEILNKYDSALDDDAKERVMGDVKRWDHLNVE